MKKIIATAAIAACSSLGLSGAAHAQSSVTVYGLLDAAVDYNTNVDATGRSRVWMPSLGGGMFPSRIGFRGTEDLGGGLKAIFTLETGVYVDTGGTGQGNRLFGRQAWVGLAGNWGQLTLGRNYNMLYNSMPEVEIIGPTQYGLGSLDAGIPNGREDNSVAYKGTFGKFTVGASYSLGRDTSSAGGPGGTNCPGEAAADAQACREWSAMLRYDAGSWGVTSAYVRERRRHGSLRPEPQRHRRQPRPPGRLHQVRRLAPGSGAVVRNNEGSARDAAQQSVLRRRRLQGRAGRHHRRPGGAPGLPQQRQRHQDVYAARDLRLLEAHLDLCRDRARGEQGRGGGGAERGRQRRGGDGAEWCDYGDQARVLTWSR
jgi:hypothetical protein